MISQSVLIERMKINGSLARKAMRTLEDMGLIKKVVHHHGQWVYSAFSSDLRDSSSMLASQADHSYSSPAITARATGSD
jgi:ribosomal protein S19E (S16A)